ncbi:hypothetical protein VB711_17505 [Cronbergia sp. UHCC 0137]|uniref:hypothetical protein n=1 Tax=Cronbergia sp. UHCC 0137 TaxID=3110239 RepID=UPI002B20A6B6|nr:hypothetical protein [Cronbergia sp. UHCC 0137]MEA5619623.1 hypothetical protein [Cronbergia sp. UHCC 0137]
MTQLVADKTPISTKYERRKSHTPSFWITVFITSISLHFLGFWLIRSGDDFGLWFPSSNQNNIAIDLIDIPAAEKSPITTPKSTTKTVRQTPEPIKAKTSEATTKSQNDDAIKTEVKSEAKTQSYTAPTNKNNNRPTSKQTSQPLDPTPTPTVPLDDLPWNRRQEVKLGQGKLLPQDIPPSSPEPTQESSPTPKIATSPQPTQESSPTRNTQREGAIATISSIPKNELSQLIQQKQWRIGALPDVLAEYKGSNTKQIDLTLVPGDGGIKSAKILASLVIDQNGKFQQAVILEIEPAELTSEKSIYEEALNQLFQSDKFIAAYNQDGSQPPLSNLFLRISILITNLTD